MFSRSFAERLIVFFVLIDAVFKFFPCLVCLTVYH
jgi:hypothetical protein